MRALLIAISVTTGMMGALIAGHLGIPVGIIYAGYMIGAMIGTYGAVTLILSQGARAPH